MNEMQYFVSFRLTFYCCNEINGMENKEKPRLPSGLK